MSYVVYWLEEVVDLSGMVWVPRHAGFGSTEMTAALNFCQLKRNAGARHVSMSSEDANSVGKLGVDSIVDGKTPDGQPYTWMKRRTS